jgi:hypothetical protein
MRILLIFAFISSLLASKGLTQTEKIHGVYNFGNNQNDTILYLAPSGYFSLHYDFFNMRFFSKKHNKYIDGLWTKNGGDIYINAFKQPNNWNDIKINKYEKIKGEKKITVKLNLKIDSASLIIAARPWLYIVDSRNNKYKFPDHYTNQTIEFNFNRNISWFRILGDHLTGVYPIIPLTPKVNFIELDLYFSFFDQINIFSYSKFCFQEKLKILKNGNLEYDGKILSKNEPVTSSNGLKK